MGLIILLLLIITGMLIYYGQEDYWKYCFQSIQIAWLEILVMLVIILLCVIKFGLIVGIFLGLFIYRMIATAGPVIYLEDK